MTSEKLLLRVVNGGFQPCDDFTKNKLRDRHYSIGEIVSAQITKPRNPKFHRLVHGLGTLIAENIGGFEGMGSHQVIKRLQREALIECDEFVFRVPNCGMVTQYIPRSLSFESMSEEVFSDLYAGICRYIVREYWPSETTESIQQMVELMP